MRDTWDFGQEVNELNVDGMEWMELGKLNLVG